MQDSSPKLPPSSDSESSCPHHRRQTDAVAARAFRGRLHTSVASPSELSPSPPGSRAPLKSSPRFPHDPPPSVSFPRQHHPNSDPNTHPSECPGQLRRVLPRGLTRTTRDRTCAYAGDRIPWQAQPSGQRASEDPAACPVVLTLLVTTLPSG